MQPVKVTTRVGVFDGTLDGPMAFFDGPVFVERDTAVLQRSYLLLTEGVKLTRPCSWTDHRAGAWYIDIVDCQVRPGEVTVIDRYIDFIVPADANGPYRVLDLDELGDALRNEGLTVEDAARALRNAQAFVDTHLHRVGERQRGTWKDFPPAVVVPHIVDNRPMPAGSVKRPAMPPPGWSSRGADGAA